MIIIIIQVHASNRNDLATIASLFICYRSNILVSLLSSSSLSSLALGELKLLWLLALNRSCIHTHIHKERCLNVHIYSPGGSREKENAVNRVQHGYQFVLQWFTDMCVCVLRKPHFPLLHSSNLKFNKFFPHLLFIDSSFFISVRMCVYMALLISILCALS